MVVMDSNARMIKTQAEHITRLNKEVKRLKQENELLEIQLKRKREAADFYLSMQNAIISNPFLQNEWEKFLQYLKLALDKDEITDLGG